MSATPPRAARRAACPRPGPVRARCYAAHSRLAWGVSLLIHAAGLALCHLAPVAPDGPRQATRPEALPVCPVMLAGVRAPLAFDDPARGALAPPRPAPPGAAVEPFEPPLPRVPRRPCRLEPPRPPERPDERAVPRLPDIPAPPVALPVARPEPDDPPPAEPPTPKPARPARTPPSVPSPGSDQATVDVVPTPTHNPPPPYPRAARRNRYEGLVILLVRVSREGAARSVDVTQSSGHAVLDDAARRAVERWRFRPATVDGRSAEAALEVPIRFKLTD